jgi:hypothetical protein
MTISVLHISDKDEHLGYPAEEILYRKLVDHQVGVELPPVVTLGPHVYENFILSVVKNRLRHWGQETYYDGPCGWVRIERGAP